MTLLEQVLPWVLRPLPTNALVDEALHARIETLAQQLPSAITDLDELLDGVRVFREYDAAANLACAHVWLRLGSFHDPGQEEHLRALAHFAQRHFVDRARARLFRVFLQSTDRALRDRVRLLVRRAPPREVALPLQRDGDWDASGWLRGVNPAPLGRHPQGKRAQAKAGVPPLATVADLRALLGIRSAKQLGYFLLASDHNDGPYTTFTIPKRGGGERPIRAPKTQLRWVQRRLLHAILDRIPAHDAAHGFVPGRSTLTNALPHLRSDLLLKFDLKDFFPTVRYHRVVGLFARLGYYVGDARFRADDSARQVAPTLARLCCYTPNPKAWGEAVLPQGAPTSPAITNLICRRLDSRLTGLATRGGGVYTRYADDLTFSFKKPAVHLGRFRWWVDQICHQEGFFINHAKFRVIRRSQRQLVTGVVVNEEARLPRAARRRFRAILHNCRVHGVESQARGHPRFAEYLRGFASYAHMIYPEEGRAFLRQVDELLGRDPGETEPEG